MMNHLGIEKPKPEFLPRSENEGYKELVQMSTQAFDLLVVGGGPGGYTVAVRGAQKGMKTLLIERDALGGTCLNRGCLPTKTFLEDTLTIFKIRQSRFLKGDMKINFKRILERKEEVVEGAVAGITGVIKGNGAEILKGKASFTAPKKMEIETEEGQRKEISAKNIILATGAEVDYGDLAVDEENILSTDGALNLKSVPSTVAIVGAGNRGVEFAGIYSNLGSRVVLIEKEKRILPREHRWLSGRYKKILTERNIQVLTRSKVVAAESERENGVLLALESRRDPNQVKVKKVVLALSRRPSFRALNLEAAGLSLSEGMLSYGPGMQSEVGGIYVVGDAVGAPYLAHKAIAQGIAAVDHMLGLDPDGRPRFVPNCIYGDPEIGSVGLTDYGARKAGLNVKTGEFYLVGNGRAGTMGKEEGLVLIVSDEDTGNVLGVHILGPRATELVSLGVLAMKNGLTVEDLKKTVLPHLTISESFFEAALASSGEAIHMLSDSVEHDPED